MNLDAGLPLREIKSALHPIDVEKQGVSHAKIKLRDMDSLPNKDFILRYKVAGEKVQGGVIAYAPSGNEGGYFTMVLQPPDAPKADEIAPKEMVFVIDQTGSQAGLPIAKAKETIRYCLQNLKAKDTFQLLGFNTQVFSCFAAPVPATKENIAKAVKWLEPIEGSGGTDILKSIDYALKIPGDRARPRIICYMTDGYVGNDAQIIEHIAKNRGAVRIFPFGVGNSVNRYLIDGMAREGRGEAEIITLSEDSQKVAQRFYERVAQPLLLDVAVDWGDLPVEDVLPRYIPDVFSAKPIILKRALQTRGAGRNFAQRLIARPAVATNYSGDFARRRPAKAAKRCPRCGRAKKWTTSNLTAGKMCWLRVKPLRSPTSQTTLSKRKLPIWRWNIA